MCFVKSSFNFSKDINWEGDKIVFDTSIPAMRPIPDKHRTKRYPIDIREFLTSERNSVMSSVLSEIADSIPKDSRYRFFERKRGYFDYRAYKILEYVCDNVRYVSRSSRNFDSWLFPDETVAQRSGDCEDISFLIASLLIASGISPYMVRVALGHVLEKAAGTNETTSIHQHAWVMYRSESGQWLLFDPLATNTSWTASKSGKAGKRVPKRTSSHSFEYRPAYVFNSDHLWRMEQPKTNTDSFTKYVHSNYKRGKKFWKSFNPKFGAGTHASIFMSALYDTGLFSQAEIFLINAASLAIDADVFSYHPYDHFDNGYISEGWQRVNERLATGSLVDFAHAVHAVADFYAHSSYGHFYLNKKIPIYQGGLDLPNKQAVLDSVYMTSAIGANLDSLNLDNFSSNDSNAPSRRTTQMKSFWRDHEIVSGRYAQPGDSQEGFLSPGYLTHYPRQLKTASELSKRKWLPHHNEIAVDGDTISPDHKLYSETTYKRQYDARVDAAKRHTMELGKKWKAAHPESGL